MNTAQEARGWFDTANPDTSYRGFFFAVEGAAQSFAGGAVPQITWTVRAKLIIEFRGVR